MSPQTMMNAVILLGLALLCYFGWQLYKKYKSTADDKEKKKLIKVYAIVGVITIVLFAGIRLANLPELLFPGYYTL